MTSSNEDGRDLRRVLSIAWLAAARWLWVAGWATVKVEETADRQALAAMRAYCSSLDEYLARVRQAMTA